MNIVIFGAGDYGHQALKLMNKKNVLFFIDNDIKKIGTFISGVPVYPFNMVGDKLKKYHIIIAVSYLYVDEIKEQLASVMAKDYELFIDMQMKITREKIENRPDFLNVYNRAINWILTHTVDEPIGKSIINNTKLKKGYPEVTGYYIPTLLRWGYRNLAVEFAKWLCSIQKPDGSWYDTDDRAPYVFDSAQILKGLLAVRSIYPKVDDTIQMGCNWIISNMEPDGRLVTPDTLCWTTKECSELIHIYCLSPLCEAARIFKCSIYEQAAQKILLYYLTNYKADIEKFLLLSHFYAYIMEGLLDMGEIELVKSSMANIAKLQTKEGMVPAYEDKHWVCSTGLFQFALVWYRLGEIENAERAFNFGIKLQNRSGGWYGSYLINNRYKEINDYFPNDEISWSVKYFLDALYYKNCAEFDVSAPKFKDSIEKNDGRYQILLSNIKKINSLSNNVTRKILDVGCGKGRYLYNLIEDLPNNQYYGVDISQKVINEKTSGHIHWQMGTLTCIPFDDNFFDVVYACESLEHAIDIVSAVKELVRVTKPGGEIIIIDKNIEFIGALEIMPWEQWFDKKNLSVLMKKMCSEVKFIDDISYENNFREKIFSIWIGIAK